MRYIKRARVIEAKQWDGSEASAQMIISWMGSGTYNPVRLFNDVPFSATLVVGTEENLKDRRVKHVAYSGDYILKEYDGEYYVCDKVYFEDTYILFT